MRQRRELKKFVASILGASLVGIAWSVFTRNSKTAVSPLSQHMAAHQRSEAQSSSDPEDDDELVHLGLANSDFVRSFDRILPSARTSFSSLGGLSFLVAVVPFLLAILRLIDVSDFNPQYFAVWLAGISPLNMWINGTVFISQALFGFLWAYFGVVLFVGGLEHPIPGTRAFWTPQRILLVLANFAFGALCTALVVAPVWSGLLVCAIFATILTVGLSILGYTALRTKSGFLFLLRHFRHRVAGYSLIVAAIGLHIVISNFETPPGVPRERVVVREEVALSDGYVISVDDNAVTFGYIDGGVRRIPTGDVTERAICPSSQSNLFPGLSRILAKSTSIPALCNSDRPLRSVYP